MEYIYIFVNPKSGGRRAANFFEPDLEELRFSKPVIHTIRIFSIEDGDVGRRPGMLHLKNFLDSKDPQCGVKVLIAGGDGTVMWVVKEMDTHGVNYDDIVFGVIPYGTGNDFSRAINWNNFNGIIPFQANLAPLRKIMERVFNSTVIHHDFWKVSLTVEPEGSFNKINSTTRKKETVVDEHGADVLRMDFVMGNYFSIGIDGRIGRNFDRHRSHSIFFNKFIYLVEGIKKSFMAPVMVNRQIEKMLYGPSFSETVFTTDANNLDSPILPESSSLIALNIPSYSSGIDCFSRAKNVGLYNLPESDAKELMSVSQEMGDGRLEFVSYRKLQHIGLDYLFHGFSRRVHAGRGPWKIVFKQLSPREKVYFQVDGEFFVMLQPRDVEIAHDKTIKMLK